jgi:galactoside O-acetyltransferase
MTQYERMLKGLVFDICDKDIMEIQNPYKQKLWEFNQLSPSETQKKQEYMKEVFAECGEDCFIESPLYASWGGKNVHFGRGIYANFNLTLIDDGNIYIGNRVLIGPNVVIATANHPLNPDLRRYEFQYNRDVHIGDNAWIGAGAIILPGVNIGKNSVIGAGSVVTRDIPENVLAVGNPCRVVREIGESDREFYYRDERVDWKNLDSICDRKSKLPKFQ